MNCFSPAYAIHASYADESGITCRTWPVSNRNCCIGNTAIQFCGRIDRRGQTELVALVLVRKTNATFFNETPKTRHDNGSFVVERKHPVIVAMQHRLEPMLREPR